MGNSSSTKRQKRRGKKTDPAAKAKAAHLLFGRHPKATEFFDRELIKDPSKTPAQDWAFLQSKIDEYLATESQDPKRLHVANLWNKCQGQELERVLQSGSIALLNAQWLVNYYYDQKSSNNSIQDDDGQEEQAAPVVLPCRQKLPPNAFLSFEEIKTCRCRHTKLQIIAVSHMWLQPSHPDPFGTTLALLVTWIQERLRQSRQGIYLGGYPKWAIFWDYASLHQHPDLLNGIHRSNEEEKLFRDGLDGLATLFSHPFTHCYKVTKFPANYPEGYDLPAGANCAGYNERGWTFVESSLVSLVKTNDMVRDISVNDLESVTPQAGKQQGKNKNNSPRGPITMYRQAPMTPTQLEKRLETLSFTNAKDDRPLVLELYTHEFERRFGNIQILKLGNLQWGDLELEQLSHVIGSGYTPKLRKLLLGMNQFGQPGCDSLAKALLAVDAPRLREIDLSNNKGIGDEGISGLVDCFMGIHTIQLNNVNLGVASCHKLAQAAANQTKDGIGLRKLSLLQNPNIGDEGTKLLAPLVVRHLREITLGLCNVSDEGWHAMADSAANEGTSPLTLISIYATPSLTDAGYDHVARLLSHCPQLERLVIRQHGSAPLSDELQQKLKSACPNPKLFIPNK